MLWQYHVGLTLCSQQTVMSHTIVCLPDLRSTAARMTETSTSLADRQLCAADHALNLQIQAHASETVTRR